MDIEQEFLKTSFTKCVFQYTGMIVNIEFTL